MTQVAELWSQAASKWNEVAGQIGEADWEKSTTCPDWSVRDLVDHAMHWQGTGAGALGGNVGPDSGWEAIEPALRGALEDPANLEGTVEAFGGMPKQGVAGLLIGDLLVHSWDLARSIGADDTLPAEVVESTLMGLQRLPEPMLRGENMFGPAVDVAADAPAQDRLLAFVGRRP